MSSKVTFPFPKGDLLIQVNCICNLLNIHLPVCILFLSLQELFLHTIIAISFYCKLLMLNQVHFKVLVKLPHCKIVPVNIAPIQYCPHINQNRPNIFFLNNDSYYYYYYYYWF
jgi:hypothetical protein